MFTWRLTRLTLQRVPDQEVPGEEGGRPRFLAAVAHGCLDLEATTAPVQPRFLLLRRRAPYFRFWAERRRRRRRELGARLHRYLRPKEFAPTRSWACSLTTLGGKEART